MLPIYQDRGYTFRFADDRLIPRFHLEGVLPGVRVSVFKIDPDTGEHRELLVKAEVGAGGWVELPVAIPVRAGEAFFAVPATPPRVRPETVADHDAVCQVHRAAFGQDAEARLVDALQDGGYARVSLVAEQVGQVVGHILFSDLPILTEAGTVPALALARMAVLPNFQNQGIGSALVRSGLEVCRQQGHRIVVVLGHPHFYPRFGFSPDSARRLESPYAGEASMAVELVPGALGSGTGRVEYPPPFAGF